ncbi:MATE family efflux transporter [Gilvimarinus chinensis]|uniref:MATE family efflux transporter n=1 Tax=Gilvimarinus chinensis TaxID=396005 RepID=UPI000365026C|nr:MATE family efflux transporter [Gilvimarinus chinensis]
MSVTHSDYNPATDGPSINVFFRYVGASVAGLLALTGAALVDGIMVGKWLGADALAAVNLLIPLWTLLFGLVLMLAIGGSVAASRYLGARKYHAANIIFSGCLCSAGISAAILASAAWFFDRQLLALLAVPETLLIYAKPYLHIMLLGLIPQYLAVVLYYFLRVAGQPSRASRALVLGALVNIVLDVVLLAGLQWDIRAAALATTAAQITQCVLLLHTYRRSQRLRWQPKWLALRQMFKLCGNGLSEFVNEVSAGIVLLAVHWILSRDYGVAAIAGFAVTNYTLLLNIMLACAIAEVVHVLVSQNRGAGNWRRVNRFWQLGMGLAAASGALLWLLAMFSKGLLGTWFFQQASPQAAFYTQQFLTVVAPVFFLTGINLVMSAWFTGLQMPRFSALLALSRSLILPLVFILVLRLLPQNPLFLWALPLAELLTFVLAIGLKKQHSARKAELIVTG